MMKPDERQLLEALQRENCTPLNRTNDNAPRYIIEQLGIPPKRAWGILEKWTSRGWYEYGVAVDMGWLTSEGVAAGKN